MTDATQSSSELLDSLKVLLGEDHVLTSADQCRRFGTDRTTLWFPRPAAVVFPQSVEEVQAVVRLANRHSFPIVPSGGRTGLSGGAVASKGELVLAMDRMNRVLGFDSVDRSITVQAGVITAVLQDYVRERSLFYPVDFAAAGSSQIGGNVATNAGGIRVIRYGMTRDWVRGLKVVTGSGELIDCNHGLIKNNTGFDFRHLFIGSEGTLGVICEVTLALTRPPAQTVVMVLGAAEFAGLMQILANFRQMLELSAFEFFSHKGLEKVLADSDLKAPFEIAAPFYALLEFELGSGREMDTAMACFESCVEQGLVLDGVVSQSLAQAQALWKLRENLSETLARWKPYKNDISVSVSRMPEFIARIDALVSQEYSGFEVIWYGHIGDGNLHLNVLKPDALDLENFETDCKQVSRHLAELVAEFNGSISAEHGIGLLKKDYLAYTRSEVELEVMRRIKRIFDPKGIMNPGKIFDIA